MAETSTKPYMLRAIYEWCADNGYTPHLAFKVDDRTAVPNEHVENGEMVLNISFTATKDLKMENEFIYFKARFSGVEHDIVIPVDNVLAIYGQENGQGMAFEATASSPVKPPARPKKQAPVPVSIGLSSVPTSKPAMEKPADPDDGGEPPKKGGRPTLTRIK